jgi:FKBP-type peptidyl-prolyl cis-trans isomerase
MFEKKNVFFSIFFVCMPHQQKKVATGQVIRGWDETFSNMKVGERRKIILPSRLAYGDRGAGT